MKPIETKSLVLLQHHLKMLRLPTMHDDGVKNWPHVALRRTSIIWRSCCSCVS